MCLNIKIGIDYYKGSVIMISLNEIKLGDKCRVTDVLVDDSMLRRFLDIGIIPGAMIEKILVGPFKGIAAYCVMGTIIAIRDVDSEGIKVEYAEV